jgi:FlaA1/EpsC-like NDP-sugar epimerase
MKGSVTRLLTLPRDRKRWLMIGADLLLLPAALWGAYAMRFAQVLPEAMVDVWWLFPATALLGVLIFSRLGLYRTVVRFMGTRAIWSVAAGVSLLALVILTVAGLGQIGIPRAVPISFAIIAFVLVGGVRFLVRAWYHWLLGRGSSVAEPVIIFGAGAAGAHLAKSLMVAGWFHPVAFVDEDSTLHRSLIDGIEIFDPARIPELLELFPVRRILLAIPSASRGARRRILNQLEAYPVHVQTVPNTEELLTGSANLAQLRDVDIGDLLGRDPVPPIPELMARSLRGRVIMVSGAGGSIGSALCRVAVFEGVKTLVLYDHHEYALYAIDRELRTLVARRGLGCELVPIVGSVGNASRLRAVMGRFGVQTVFHSAAYKHVPMMEQNVLEGVRNNVFGTRIFAEAAAECGVERFVLISTDKAVRPTSVMGATKRLAELVLQDLASRSQTTIFAMVRFGNVLASSGSVVPVFHEQISRGGPVTVTHPNVTRYFMTLTEASQLVVQAGAMATGGEVFVLDMGEPVRIVDLAKRMIRLHGLRVLDEQHPTGDIRIDFTGLRPGEKLYEELLIGDNATGTAHPKIMRAEEEALLADRIKAILEQLHQAEQASDPGRAYAVLRGAVPDFLPASPQSDWLVSAQGLDEVNADAAAALRLSDSPVPLLTQDGRTSTVSSITKAREGRQSLSPASSQNAKTTSGA